MQFKNTIISLRWSPDHKTLYAAGLTGELSWIDPQSLAVKHTRRIGTALSAENDKGPGNCPGPYLCVGLPSSR